MTTVNSWNEWDPLKHVIVGTVEQSNIPPMEPALEPKISKDSGMAGSPGTSCGRNEARFPLASTHAPASGS